MASAARIYAIGAGDIAACPAVGGGALGDTTADPWWVHARSHRRALSDRTQGLVARCRGNAVSEPELTNAELAAAARAAPPDEKHPGYFPGSVAGLVAHWRGRALAAEGELARLAKERPAGA